MVDHSSDLPSGYSRYAPSPPKLPHLSSRAVVKVYAREQDRELLKDFYYQDDKRVASALLALDDAREAKVPENKIELVRAASKFFSEDKERGWEAKVRPLLFPPFQLESK